MHLGIKRRAVSEWRDDQILAAVDLINRKIMIARAALDREFRDATARDAIFPSTLANGRIDALTRDMLAPEIQGFMVVAASGLVEIDERLQGLAERLIAEPMIASIPSDPGLDHADPLPQATTHLPSSDVEPGDVSTPSAAWLTRLPERLKKGASSLAESAGSAADTLITDTLGMSERIRSAATRRIENEWADESNPESVLAKIVTVIDEAAFSARVTLT